MKPPVFAYAAPETMSEVLELKREHGDDAKVLAGGQSLVPLMNFRLAQPRILIDISRVPGLDDIARSNGSVAIRAMARQTAVERSAEIRAALPAVAGAMPLVGHVATRARGTFVGSAAHADPAAEIPALLTALGAELIATSSEGERAVSADDFFKGYFTTALAPEEVLSEVRLPIRPDVRAAFLEVARRHGDFALVSAAVALTFEGSTVRSARIVIGAVADVPQRATAAEDVLRGRSLDQAAATEASGRVASELRPTADVHASARYRQRVAGVLVERALARLMDT
jgi:aerobic carbon-monoxide dehydrogenase medium subunit